jgi:hypothetical protein
MFLEVIVKLEEHLFMAAVGAGNYVAPIENQSKSHYLRNRISVRAYCILGSDFF